MFFDPIYLVVIGVGMALSLWAQAKVKGAFHKYSQIPTRSGLTGAEVAKQILAQHSISDVTIEPIRGAMTDHYDPRSKKLRLSEPVYGGRSMAAFGVAAHEVGHAIQHAERYAPMELRSGLVPAVHLSSTLAFPMILAGFFMLAAALNFSLYYALWRGQAEIARRDIELRVFVEDYLPNRERVY